MSQIPADKVKPTVHPGWGRPLSGAAAPSPPAIVQKRAVVRRPATPDYYVPADDPAISKLVEWVGEMSDVTLGAVFRGDAATAGGLHLAKLTDHAGWLMIARHRFQTLGVVTEHYVISATSDSMSSLHPEAGLYLARCPFEPTDTATEVSEAVGKTLRQGLQRQTPRFARQRHERNVARIKDRIGLLADRLAEFDREIAATRSALRAFVRRTDAYLALQEQLNRLLQEDRRVFVERRKLRGGGHHGITSLDDLHESTQPIGIIHWRVEV